MTTKNPYINEENAQNLEAKDTNSPSLLNNLATGDFVKGALIGAALGYILTNEKAQKAIFSTIAKGTSLLQMGVEEMKERYEDAKASIEE